jgi:pimeloyl-ACP methyl ester carboxylesterase
MYTIRSRRIKLGGLNIRYYTGGKGEPLVVLHGGNSHGGPWAKNLRELAHRYTVYVPDFPGFGLSEAWKGSYYIPEFTNFINEFVKAVKLDNFYLMGHSVGGAVAANYTLCHPDQVKKLILIDSMCFGEEIALWARVVSSPPLVKSVGYGIINVLKGARWVVQGMFRSMDFMLPVSEGTMVISCSAMNLQSQTVVLKHRLSEIMAPTLIVWGSHDRVVPLKHAYAAAEIIPDCKLKVIDGGHCAYQEKLTEFSRTVSDFLR